MTKGKENQDIFGGCSILIGICTLQGSQHLVIVSCPITGLVPLIIINWLGLHNGTELGWTFMKTLSRLKNDIDDVLTMTMARDQWLTSWGGTSKLTVLKSTFL